MGSGMSANVNERGIIGGKATPVFIVGGTAQFVIVDAAGNVLYATEDAVYKRSGPQLMAKYQADPERVNDGDAVALLADNEGRLVVGNFYELAMANFHAPAANTNAVVTYAATPNRRHQISGLVWAYDAAPTGGQLTIVAGGNLVFAIYITAGGPGFIDWVPPARTQNANTALVFTLGSAGAAVTGILNIKGHRLI